MSRIARGFAKGVVRRKWAGLVPAFPDGMMLVEFRPSEDAEFDTCDTSALTIADRIAR